MHLKRIAILATDPTQQPLAEALAKQLQIPLLHQPAEIQHTDYVLLITPNYIGLQPKGSKHPIYIDFVSGKMRYRSKQAGLHRELIGKAMGLRPCDNPIIIDATAGWGRDSFILATLGFRVTMLEQSLILHTLLQDALNRARQDIGTAPIIERLSLIYGDTVEWLKTAQPRPDIIYLDPMFPPRKKSASVKKEMLILHDLLGSAENEQALFQAAAACATTRIVVKRPRLAPNIIELQPTYSLTGKSSRFDIYLT